MSLYARIPTKDGWKRAEISKEVWARVKEQINGVEVVIANRKAPAVLADGPGGVQSARASGKKDVHATLARYKLKKLYATQNLEAAHGGMGRDCEGLVGQPLPYSFK